MCALLVPLIQGGPFWADWPFKKAHSQAVEVWILCAWVVDLEAVLETSLNLETLQLASGTLDPGQ